MSALLLCVLAATPVTYSYAEATKTREVTDWSKEPRVWVATHGAKLRERPTAEAPVVFELPFGAKLTILQSAGDALDEVNGRYDRWYRVATEGKGGYLFGDAITSARFEGDFDVDGDLELATVTVTSDFMIRVRFYEPKEKRETHVDFEPSGRFAGQKGGAVQPVVVTKATAGLPLIHVDSHVEACSDFSDTYVAYTNGAPRIAMRLEGLVGLNYEVEFQPARKRAVIKWRQFDGDESPPKETREVRLLEVATPKPAE